MPTAMFTVKASIHSHTQPATTRLSVGTSHRLVHFYSPPLLFFCSPLATRVSDLPFSLLRFRASAVLQDLPRRLVVVATLKTELSAVPRGNRQLLLRLGIPHPPQSFRNGRLDDTQHTVSGELGRRIWKYIGDRTGQ